MFTEDYHLLLQTIGIVQPVRNVSLLSQSAWSSCLHNSCLFKDHYLGLGTSDYCEIHAHCEILPQGTNSLENSWSKVICSLIGSWSYCSKIHHEINPWTFLQVRFWYCCWSEWWMSNAGGKLGEVWCMFPSWACTSGHWHLHGLKPDWCGGKSCSHLHICSPNCASRANGELHSVAVPRPLQPCVKVTATCLVPSLLTFFCDLMNGFQHCRLLPTYGEGWF